MNNIIIKPDQSDKDQFTPNMIMLNESQNTVNEFGQGSTIPWLNLDFEVIEEE